MPIGPEIVFTVAGVLAVIYLVQEFRTWWKGNKKKREFCQKNKKMVGGGRNADRI